MTILIAVFATLLLALGCIGWGSLVLSLFRAHEYIDDAVERAALCFAVGLGVVGWVLFYPGIAGVFRPEVFWGLSLFGTIALLPGIHRFRRGITGTGKSPTNISWIGICLCAALVLVLGMDLLEGISPPADADTLAYHFALPKDFVDAGRVFFVPRALSGAIPLLFI